NAHLHASYYSSLIFFFTTPASTKIYTLSLHDALPIFRRWLVDDREIAAELLFIHAVETLDFLLLAQAFAVGGDFAAADVDIARRDRKSTRLNSSHLVISYAVFCLKKKKSITHTTHE